MEEKIEIMNLLQNKQISIDFRAFICHYWIEKISKEE